MLDDGHGLLNEPHQLSLELFLTKTDSYKQNLYIDNTTMPKRGRELVRHTDDGLIEVTIGGKPYEFDSIVHWEVYACPCKHNPENVVLFLYIQTPTDEYNFQANEDELVALEEELELL